MGTYTYTFDLYTFMNYTFSFKSVIFRSSRKLFIGSSWHLDLIWTLDLRFNWLRTHLVLLFFESSVSKWKLAISYCIHCTIRYAEAHGVLLSCFRTNPHPWKLQNRYVCPDGIFPAGPLLASGRPKESHFSSHFIGPYHLFLYLSCTSKLWQFGWPNISGFDQIPNLIPAQYVSEISSWCNFFCF